MNQFQNKKSGTYTESTKSKGITVESSGEEGMSSESLSRDITGQQRGLVGLSAQETRHGAPVPLDRRPDHMHAATGRTYTKIQPKKLGENAVKTH